MTETGMVNWRRIALPLTALLLALLPALPGAAQALRQLAPQRIAAVVNDDVVSVQDLTDAHCAKIDEHTARKEKEILTV